MGHCRVVRTQTHCAAAHHGVPLAAHHRSTHVYQGNVHNSSGELRRRPRCAGGKSVATGTCPTAHPQRLRGLTAEGADGHRRRGDQGDYGCCQRPNQQGTSGGTHFLTSWTPRRAARWACQDGRSICPLASRRSRMSSAEPPVPRAALSPLPLSGSNRTTSHTISPSKMSQNTPIPSHPSEPIPPPLFQPIMMNSFACPARLIGHTSTFAPGCCGRGEKP